MRTTRGQTPLQIFMLHANDAFLQEAEQISNYSFYGIDKDGPIPSSEFQQVVVPRNSIVLDYAQFTALQSAVDPLSDSNNYGIELYDRQNRLFLLHEDMHSSVALFEV